MLMLKTLTTAWADWSGSTYTVTADETINITINVGADATLTINEDVTMTINGGIVIADGKTLTITGGGTLAVNASNGGTGSNGGNAISGNVIINGVTVNARGGNGGDGIAGTSGEPGNDSYGGTADSGGTGGEGGAGGKGGAAFSSQVIMISGTIIAYGGNGGAGGTGGAGGQGGTGYDQFETVDDYEGEEMVGQHDELIATGFGGAGGEGGLGGFGGDGGYAFAGTLIFYGGNVYAYGGEGGGKGAGGAAGSGGGSETGGDGSEGSPGGDGYPGNPENAFYQEVTKNAASYTMTNGTEEKIDNETDLPVVYISAADAEFIVDSGNCGTSGHESEVTWSLNILGQLTISGTGAMADYTQRSDLPWYDYLTAIKTVVINEGVTGIGEAAFNGCSSLVSVSIPASVTGIGAYAFGNCSSLTSVSIPFGVAYIGYQAFQVCSSLESVTIPGSVKEIQYAAFMNCPNLASVSIEDGVEVIQQVVFQGCSSLASFNIPASVTTIGENAFTSTGWYTDHADGLLYKDNWLLGYKGDVSGDVSIENGTKYIAIRALKSCTGLTSVSIPASVTSISTQTFNGCSNLASFNIPASVTEIGVNAFSGTKWYTDHADGLLYKDNWLLGYKGSKPTGTLSIEDGTKGIAAGAFSGCTGLTSVSIPASVTSIGTQTFYGCSGLTSVSIGDGVKSIGTGAFYICSNLASFNIPASVTTIGENAFSSTGWYNSHADGLLYKDNWLLGYKGDAPTGDLTIENGTKGIAGTAFIYCLGLTSVSIPASVTTIGNGAFFYCLSLTSIILNSNPFIDRYALYLTPATVTMNLTAKEGATGEYWTTFYNENYNFQVPTEGTQIFKAALSGSALALTELETDKIIAKNNAVILKSTASSISLTLTTTNSSNDFTCNSLLGVNDASGLTANGTHFVLNKTAENGVGFYKMTSGKVIGVGKAYLTYSGALAKEYFSFEEDATRVANVNVNDNDNCYYDLQGRCVSNGQWSMVNGQSLKRGLYIVNGKKTVIK